MLKHAKMFCLTHKYGKLHTDINETHFSYIILAKLKHINNIQCLQECRERANTYTLWGIVNVFHCLCHLILKTIQWGRY